MLREVDLSQGGRVRCSLSGKRVWVAGHTGMVGSALVRRLEREGCQLLTVTRSQVDLRRQSEVEAPPELGADNKDVLGRD